MCQDINHTLKKLKEKSVLLTEVFGLNIIAISVVNLVKKNNHIIKKVKDIFAEKSVKVNFIPISHFGNKTIIRVSENKDNQNGFTRQDTEKIIPKEYLILKQEDMLNKVRQKVHILLKNGKNLKNDININVRIVNKLKNLQKTMLNLFLSVAQTILRTFNLYAEVVIVGSGRNFNIYENPELSGDKT